MKYFYIFLISIIFYSCNNKHIYVYNTTKYTQGYVKNDTVYKWDKWQYLKETIYIDSIKENKGFNIHINDKTYYVYELDTIYNDIHISETTYNAVDNEQKCCTIHFIINSNNKSQIMIKYVDTIILYNVYKKE